MLFFVYGAPVMDARKQVWDTIKAFLWSHPGRHLLLGDFNQIEFEDQKIGGNKILKGSSLFSEWKVDCNLIDIPFHGVPFTWTNNRQGDNTIFERLDRAYYNDDWRIEFPNVITINLQSLSRTMDLL